MTISASPTEASPTEAGASGVAVRLAPAVLSSPPRRSGRNRRVPVGLLGGAALLSLSALSGPLFPSTGAGVAASNPATTQLAQWVAEAYAVPASIPVDGDGNPNPGPARNDCHIVYPGQNQPPGTYSNPGTGPTAYGICYYKGNKKVRVLSDCHENPPGSGDDRTYRIYGNWVGPGVKSWITCHTVGGKSYRADAHWDG